MTHHFPIPGLLALLLGLLLLSHVGAVRPRTETTCLWVAGFWRPHHWGAEIPNTELGPKLSHPESPTEHLPDPSLFPLLISALDSTFPARAHSGARLDGHGLTKRHSGATSCCCRWHWEPSALTDSSRRQLRSGTPSPKALVEQFPPGKHLPFIPYTTLGGAGLHPKGTLFLPRGRIKPHRQPFSYIEVMWSGLRNLWLRWESAS